MQLSTLVQHGIGRLVGADLNFQGLSTDTRDLAPGQLFVALRGERYDAHDFVDQALAKGAVAVVVDREMSGLTSQLVVENTTVALARISEIFRDQFAGRVVAITGSCGKTTVKGMLFSILSQLAPTLATKGNFNNHIGVPLTLARLDKHYQYAVVEAGTSGPGEIHFLTQLIKPHVALANNVAAAHLSGLGSLDNIAEEKSDIYSYTASECAVVNLDDAYANTMLSKVQGKRIIGFSRQAAQSWRGAGVDCALVSAQQLRSDALGRWAFTLVFGAQSCVVQLSALGAHNVSNALAAASAALALNIPMSAIASGLEKFNGEKGRMQVKTGPHNCVLIDDSYNANPGSVKAAIDFLRQQADGVLVCGAMAELGEQAPALHQEIGRYARQQGLKHLFTVGGDAVHIARAFGEEAQFFTDKASLIEALQTFLTAGHTVLVKGSRSATMEEVVNALASRGDN